ncbi:inter alpha-trypsin inhibitor, heavy chain 4 isoform X1 [Sesamum indicum]|uniref:Inter alpha-trypsin inhibitor, heavy chain 4 isoform X1 n=3 Tax=Sesamum TaxID=4181 RepID=A0A8M8UQX7_SESIN|nr:inter alpha-trypsin inhibitor, heavy chain 4 isoform X1 [Sesamum indicum]
MAEDFQAAVEDGLRLSKRIYFGKDRAVAPPKPPTEMDRSSEHPFLPTSPMVYAVISNPSIVDNPDMPSYQPYVHGKCDPPALMPLQMNGISMEVECYMDTAFITVNGSWRVHCVMGSRSCDCRIAVPMGEQGSILGVEVEIPRKSYSTELAMDNESDTVPGAKPRTGKGKVAKVEEGPFLKPHIFTITVPKIDGGTNLLVKLKWSQKLMYHGGQFTLNVPFKFPEYVTPAGKKIPKHEKIQLTVNSCPGTEILSKTTSHLLKERYRQAGKSVFFYDSDVLSWSSSDISFAYTMSSNDTSGAVLLSSPPLLDVDRREMFSCYLFPGNKQSRKFFKREVVFVVDISGSMKGKLLEETKNALFAALTKLDPEDLFNVIAFNGETYLFASSLEPATATTVENATQWISLNFLAGGGTNILLPLNQAIEMFSDSRNSIPIIFLVTDGADKDERHICDVMKSQFTDRKDVFPRIYTLGIGMFCNHYFLRKLSILGRGHYDAATDVADSIDACFGALFARASSIFLANIAFENLDQIDELEVFPSEIPDLSSESPLVVSGRYRGTFPETLKVKGFLPDMSNFSVDLSVQEAKDIPIGKMLAKQEIELLTAEAWYSDRKELKEKIANMSIEYSIISEYTNVVLLETERMKITADPAAGRRASSKVNDVKTEEPTPRKILVLRNNGLGFGNLTATEENIVPGFSAPKPPEAGDAYIKGASRCCSWLCNHRCCWCCMGVCSRMNNECANLMTQVCGALACLGCYSCCDSCTGQEG